ncbi:MAG: SdpI family protein, partial [Candidatus Pacebacteria bacterium]|nr:SdpI family protein [Candidatus Paceibacterota bacterium]
AVSLYSALNPDVSPERYIIGGVGILFIILGNYMSKFKRNFFVGIKTPWTLSNEKVWNKTHRLGGWCFIAAGIILLLQTLLQTPYSITIMVIAIAIAAIVPVVYSGIIYHRLGSKNQL